jgi:CRP/FNR family transcriptional regulator, anaerobic regulatory protein
LCVRQIYDTWRFVQCTLSWDRASDRQTVPSNWNPKVEKSSSLVFSHCSFPYIVITCHWLASRTSSRMNNALINHIRRYISLTEEEDERVLSHFKLVKLRKKQNILEQDEACQLNVFVVRGCLRMFFINGQGVEQTTQFALENWWLTDLHAFMNRTPASYYIQAVERTEVYSISAEHMEVLVTELPAMERYFRLMYQRAAAAAQLRIKYLYELSRKESYLHFRAQFPEFVQRVPQYLLASYLNLTPEYLSEIRKKTLKDL